MSTFLGGYGHEEEDGAGWGALVESAYERGERQERERELHNARLQGRLEAYAKAMTECGKTANRGGTSIGARRNEIRTAIEILSLATLQELRPAKASNVEAQRPAASGAKRRLPPVRCSDRLCVAHASSTTVGEDRCDPSGTPAREERRATVLLAACALVR